MPHESPWPPVVALTLTLVFVALVIHHYGVAAIMAVFCALALLGWHSKEPQES